MEDEAAKAQRGSSASFSVPLNSITDNTSDGSQQTLPFLDFIHLIEQFQIPIIDPCLMDPQQRSETAVGILGKGGQYIVDRTYSNQRYPNRKGLVAESNVVYKRIIGSEQHQGPDTIHHISQLQAFVTEVRALGHLRSSSNIIKLIGVAWEVDAHAQLNPVLALEFAQHNSLARFLTDEYGSAITFWEKKALITDIVEGVYCIHESGFVWGDCKPDNVLICQDQHDPTSFRAKISDFGLSVSGNLESARFRGFSIPWTASEARDAVGMTALRRAEIYALGLVIWAVLLNGQQFQKAMWDVKGPLEIEDNGSISNRQILALTASNRLKDIALQTFSSSMMFRVSEVEIQYFSDILRRCLAADPETRLSIKDLRGTLNGASEAPPTKKYVHTNSCGKFDMEWLTKTFGPTTRLHAVCMKIVNELEVFIKSTASPAASYQLSLCYATALGCERNMQAAVRYMASCAELSHEKSDELHVKLMVIAEKLQTEQSVEPAVMDSLIDLWDDFEQDNHGSSVEPQDPPEAPDQEIPEPGQTMPAFTGKGKGKYVEEFPLHSAARRGDLEEVKLLLRHTECDVNERNQGQETPLLCSMKSGHHEIFKVLLQAGADPQATDANNQTLLHMLIALPEQSLDRMVDVFRSDDFSEELGLSSLAGVVASTSSIAGTELKPGTALEWAVDLRNVNAVKYLLDIGSDATTSASSAPVVHRAAARHDHEMLSCLLKGNSTEELMRFDSQGRSPLACALEHANIFDRLLLNEGDPDGITRIMNIISSQGHDFSRLNMVTQTGESAVYFALKSGCITRTLMSKFWDWNWEETSMNILPSPIGPNRWSAFRRALYCSETSSFELFCNGLGKDGFRTLLHDMSPDGLSILHELAFLPTEHGKTHFKTIVGTAALYRIRVPHIRMRPRGSRPRMTPFQLAVLCGKTDLADLFVSWNSANPLCGLENSRFLAFIIEYPRFEPYTPSTWLSLILDDAVVNSTRRFPHPTGMEQPLRHLLRNEEKWWMRARANNSYFGVIQEGPDFDQNAEHDPFLSWKPNIMTAMLFDPQGEQEPAVTRFGAGGFLDNNTFGWGHRLRHTLDYGSFLLRLNPDNQQHDLNGHPYLTALELGLSVALASEYSAHAEKNFYILLEHYSGRKYCNFPYYQYLPTGRMWLSHLRRRETILHRAVRQGKVNIVKRLIEAGTDCDMANTQWQTPLHLARLIDEKKDPDVHGNHGKFLARAHFGVSPAVPIHTVPEDPPSKKIRSALENAAIHKSRRFWPEFRAVREVKWPWDDYETDDLGLRFVLFNLALLALVTGFVSLIVHLVSFFPYIVYALGSAMSEVADVLGELRYCYIGSLHNGSDPHEACTYVGWGLAPVDLQMLKPPLENYIDSIITVLDSCYDNSTNATIPTTPHLDDDDDDEDVVLFPGCPDEVFDKDKTIDAASEEFDRVIYEFLKKECHCKCSWFNKPDAGLTKPKGIK